MVPVIILRHQCPVCRVEPQVRVGAEIVASGIGVAVDDGLRRFLNREVEIGFGTDRIGGGLC